MEIAVEEKLAEIEAAMNQMILVIGVLADEVEGLKLREAAQKPKEEPVIWTR